jgi:transposase
MPGTMSATAPGIRANLKFLRKIERETPKDKTLHLIADNYATHKHPAVEQWLAKHPRFHMHFTPTSAS